MEAAETSRWCARNPRAYTCEGRNGHADAHSSASLFFRMADRPRRSGFNFAERALERAIRKARDARVLRDPDVAIARETKKCARDGGRRASAGKHGLGQKKALDSKVLLLKGAWLTRNAAPVFFVESIKSIKISRKKRGRGLR